MSNPPATFALLQPPSFDVIPDTDVQLGTIHPRTKTRPRRPDTKRVLNRSSRVLVPDHLYRTRTDPSVALDGEKVRSGGSDFKAHLPFIQGIGGDLGGQLSNEEILHIDAKNVETQWFLPDEEYFVKALKSIAVKKELMSFRAPSVFMVTGVKIAESATIITGHKKTREGEVGPEIDLTPFNIPVQLAAKLNAKMKDYKIVPIKKTRFVMAFETRRIRLKKDGYDEEDFNDFALLDDEQKSEQVTAKNLRDMFVISEASTTTDDEE